MKKRASHVGMVLSFVIFVAFLLFIFTTLQPLTETNSQRDIFLDYLKVTITDQVSSNLTKITVSGVEDKKKLKIAPSENFDYGGDYFVVKDDEFVDIPAESVNREILIRKSKDNGLVYLYFSPEEIISGAIKNMGSEVSYEEVDISLYQERKYIFESKVLNFIEELDTEYEIVKNDLEISGANDFGVIFENAQGDIFQTLEQDVQENIYVDRIPIEYVNSSANVLHGFLSVKVW